MIDLPEDGLAQAAVRLLGPQLRPAILHHSLRTWLLAAAECRVQDWRVDDRDLAIACLFHDSGTIGDDSVERFEVTGADRAVAFARAARRGPGACRAIWDAVALHTSPGIAERHEPLTRAVRAGVRCDFGATEMVTRHSELVAELEQRYPRLDIERELAGAVVAAARARPAKAPPSSWPADLVRGADLVAGSDQPNPCF